MLQDVAANELGGAAKQSAADNLATYG